MEQQTNKASVPQSKDIDSEDYTRGLRVLARIIASRHMHRTIVTSENKDGISEDK